MKRFGLLLLTFFLAMGLAAKPDDDDRGREKRDQAKEKRDQAKDKARDKRDEQGKDKEKRGKKDKAREIARIEGRIAHLKTVAADLEAKGNTEAAANVRKTIERAEAKLAEKKKKLGITDKDVKEAESETPAEPAGETK